MGKRFINGTELSGMVTAAAGRLNANVGRVNSLNVFPVPDGDTGTNMNLTLSSGVDELNKRSSPNIGSAAEALAKGLLMGARGNSGVILSQLFRGFSKRLAALEQANAAEFAQALQQGVDTAYAAVVRPVEGTILTVAKEAAKAAVQSARRTDDVVSVMHDTLAAANAALQRTPDLLPVLKQVGVVDSGGQGLVYVYEGFLAALTGESVESIAQAPATDYSVIPPESFSALETAGNFSMPVQAHIGEETIEHGYCTEFIVKLAEDDGGNFREPEFIETLETMGDSLLVAADDELVKVHIHAEMPGEVMNYAMRFGALTKIKIENMREQHSHILSEHYGGARTGTALAESDPKADTTVMLEEQALKPYGIIAVAAGAGVSDIFTSVGVDSVLSGGQTMNPSTEQLLNAIESVEAEHIFVLPNNSNIILAAGQATELTEKRVKVIPSRSIQQGIAAVLAFRDDVDFDQNAVEMEAAAKRVKSGHVTYAVRNTQIDGIDIEEGDHIGILDDKIVAAGKDQFTVCENLLAEMLVHGDEVVSIFVGESADDAVTERLKQLFEERYPDSEAELLPGDQPVYSYLFSAE